MSGAVLYPVPGEPSMPFWTVIRLESVIASAVPELRRSNFPLMTMSCAPVMVRAGPVLGSSSAGRLVVGAVVKVMGASGVPEWVRVTAPVYIIGAICTVCPGRTWSAAAWMVHSGSAAVAGPVSEQPVVAEGLTYRVVLSALAAGLARVRPAPVRARTVETARGRKRIEDSGRKALVHRWVAERKSACHLRVMRTFICERLADWLPVDSPPETGLTQHPASHGTVEHAGGQRRCKGSQYCAARVCGGVPCVRLSSYLTILQPCFLSVLLLFLPRVGTWEWIRYSCEMHVHPPESRPWRADRLPREYAPARGWRS